MKGRCPICQAPLTGRQKTACSNRHRAELSRREREAKARAPLERILTAFLARVEEALEEAKAGLRGGRG